LSIGEKNIMKKILYLILGFALLSFLSCQKVSLSPSTCIEDKIANFKKEYKAGGCY
jgi:hypothetical protein